MTNESVFRDKEIGLRFLVPAGWTIKSRAVVPRGRLSRTVVVASYQQPIGPRAATLEVLVIDRPADDDLERALAEHGTGSLKWTPRAPARQITLNGTDALQFVLVSGQGKEEDRREATAFLRGDRVYFFALTYSAADPDVHDAIRSTVESITWTK